MIGAVLGRGRRRGAGWRVGAAASILAASTVVSVIAAGSVASAAPSDLDSSFGSSGTGVAQYSTGTGAAATGVAVVPSPLTGAGNIVVSTDGGGGANFEIARFNSSGAIDTTFGTSGVLDIFAGLANAVAVVPAGLPGAGNIVAVGEEATSTCGGEQPVIEVVTPAGGKTATIIPCPTGSLGGILNAVTIDPSGNVVVAGEVFSSTATLETVVARMTPGGTVALNVVKAIGNRDSAARGVAVSPVSPNDIYTAGYSYAGTSPVRYLTVAAFNPTSGALDTTFNASGSQPGLLTPSQSNTGANGVTVLSNGNLAVAGAVNATPSSPDQSFLAEYTAAGASSPGTITTGVASPSQFDAVAYQPDGMLVVAGTILSGASQGGVVAEYHAVTGLPNSLLGGGSGVTAIPFPQAASSLAGVSIETDGKAVVAGDAPVTNSSPDIGLARVQVPAPQPYTPVAATRICDTRPGNGLTGVAGQCNNRRMAPNTSLTVQVAGQFGVPADASSVVVNLTTVNPTGAGFLTAYPAGTTRPSTSNINVTNGQAVAGLAQVALSGGALTVFSSVSTGLFVGIEGYTAPASAGPPGAGLYNPLASPARVCDTRAGNPSGLFGTAAQCNNRRLAGGATRVVSVAGAGFGVPAGATAVVANLRAVNPTGAGVLTAYPDGSSLAGASTLSYATGPGMTISRAVLPLLADGKVDVFASAPTDVILDISGYYTAAAGSGTGFVPVATPVRICDTRTGTGLVGPAAQCNGQPLGPNSTRTVSVAGNFSVPATAKSVVVNVTALNPTVATLLTVYPGGTRPVWTDLNPPAGRSESNLVVATLSPSGAISIHNTSGTVNVLVDLEGYYAGAGS